MYYTYVYIMVSQWCFISLLVASFEFGQQICRNFPADVRRWSARSPKVETVAMVLRFPVREIVSSQREGEAGGEILKLLIKSCPPSGPPIHVLPTIL